MPSFKAGANARVDPLVPTALAADWTPSVSCPDWGATGTFSSDDDMWLAGASITVGSGPGALIRGGSFVDGSDAGPFAVSGFSLPQSSATIIGFRGAR